MKESDLDPIVARLVRAYRYAPDADLLYEEFKNCNPDVLMQTVIKITRQDEKAPSIAKLWAVYRELDAKPQNTVKCDRCDSTGWIEALNTGLPEGYTAVEPCRCTNGKHALTIQAKIYPKKDESF